MSLQDTLDAFRANFETNIAPPHAVEAMHRATAELIATGQAERALKAGAKAPSFTLPDPDGVMVSSEDLLSRGPLVLTFYRGVWCPYCNFDLQALEAAAGDIRAKGATLVAVSPQMPANSRRLQRDNKLSFPILSDHSAALADAFGIRFTLPDYLQEVYRGFKTDLPAINGDPSWTLPMPARYVIDTNGVIAYAEINPDYTRRPDPSELFPTLDSLAR